MVLLLVVTLLGGGVGLWGLQKRAGAAGEARADLDEARTFHQGEQWAEGLRALRRAETALHGTWPDNRLCQEIEHLKRDLEMAQQLEQARLLGMHSTQLEVFQHPDGSVKVTGGKASILKRFRAMVEPEGHFDWNTLVQAYGQAFMDYGLGLFVLDPQEAGKRIQDSSIHPQLVAAVDEWAYAARKAGMPSWRRLVAVARAADPDPWRNRLRDVLEGGEVQTLEELIASAGSDDLSPATAVLLARLAQGTNAAERALPVLRQVRQQHPADFWINHAFASYLSLLGPSYQEEALRCHAIAVSLKPWSAPAHLELADALAQKGLRDEAIAEYRDAIRLQDREAQRRLNNRPASRERHYIGMVDGRITRIPVTQLEPQGDARAHIKLARVLRAKGLRDEASAEEQKAQRIDANYASVYLDEGCELLGRGDVDGAIVAYREAIRLKEDYAEAHNNLGVVLESKGQLDKAAAAYREAIRHNKDDAEAHCNLGTLLLDQGQFPEAVDELRRGHELGSRQAGWRHPSAEWLSDAERLRDLDARLPALLKGQEQPKDAGERVALAQFCQLHKKRFVASVRWYSEAFAKQPKLADDLKTHNRYNAACAASLAGCGQGKDADKLDPKESARLRQQALDWLRADLKAYRQVMEKDADKAGPEITQRMQHWLTDEDFAGVRGAEALAKLPEAERKEWQKLWQEVEALRKRAAGQPKTASSDRP
jgi:eukaryotic-like serine/threonine-protein kinase